MARRIGHGDAVQAPGRAIVRGRGGAGRVGQGGLQSDERGVDP